MTTTRIEPTARRTAAQVHGRLAEDLCRLCADAGVTQRQLALAAGVGPPYLSRILRGLARPSVETYAALAAALGADLAARLYPTTGPAIRLAAAYPTHPADAIAALTGTSPWPGPALVWVRLDHGTVRLIGES